MALENYTMGFENELVGWDEDCDYCIGIDQYDGYGCGDCEGCDAVADSPYYARWYPDCDPDEGGFNIELVSTVEDYETFVEDGGIEDMISAAENNIAGVSADYSCGIHIHIDKQHFSNISMYNAMIFMNNENNNELIYNCCGREDGEYHYIRDQEITRFPISSTHANIYTAAGSGRIRYSSEHGTIEYRTFQATTDVETIKAYFQFAHAVTTFARPENFINDSEYFKRFVEENSEDYSILNSVIKGEKVCV